MANLRLPPRRHIYDPPPRGTFEPRLSPGGPARPQQSSSGDFVRAPGFIEGQASNSFENHQLDPILRYPHPPGGYKRQGPIRGKFHEHLDDGIPLNNTSVANLGEESYLQLSSAPQSPAVCLSPGVNIGSPGPPVSTSSSPPEASPRGLFESFRRFRRDPGDKASSSPATISESNIGPSFPATPNSLSTGALADQHSVCAKPPKSISATYGSTFEEHPLNSYPAVQGVSKRPNNRRGHSTGSQGLTSAVRSIFHSRKKSDGLASSPNGQKPPSPLSRISKSISQVRFRRLKLRSQSDPINNRGSRAFAPGGSEPILYHPSPAPVYRNLPRTAADIRWPLLSSVGSPATSTASQFQYRILQDSLRLSEESLLPPLPQIFKTTPDYQQSKTRFPKFRELIMEPPRKSRFLDPSSAMAAITRHKAEAMKLAREQGVAVQEMCRRAKTETPPYEFEELIGKGAYGRVYKGHQLPSRKVVAIKVMDIDSLDYKSLRDFKDESIKDFIHETKVMKQVKDSGAKNINEIIEAVSIHSQLWLVCEYCPGGSVRTLMRATGDRLEEKYLITVARELAAGLHAIHEAGIIHRDIKAANILIHEEGHLQICDFGVAGVLQSQMDKRSTWIGTPHWMPPEMFSTRGEAHKYGSEIDVWAYGCTLFEFATGNPPNSNLRERMQIGRQLNRKTPKLDEKYSEGLKNLVTFALESNPAVRPSMADILMHPYIADSEEEYPTLSLRELVRIYYQWSQRGGQRMSLFHPGGAAAAEMPGAEPNFEEDWNFSTTDGFERRFSVIDLDQIAASLAEMEQEISPQSPPEQDLPDEPVQGAITEEDKANFDERVRRGAEAMEGLFNEEMPSYKYETKNDFVPVEPKQPVSDLPLRMETDRSSVTSTFIDIDIGSFDSSHYAAGSTSAPPFQLADADTIKANRSSGRQQRNSNEARSSSSSSDIDHDSEDLTYQPATGPRPPTMDWKFPSFMSSATEESEKSEGSEVESPLGEKRLVLDQDSEAEAGAGAGAEVEAEAEAEQGQEPASDRRATMAWTFPNMQNNEAQPETVVDFNRYSTLRAPLTALQEEPSTTVRPPSIGEPGDSRPSTSTSVESSVSASSEADYDPFRFDRPSTPPSLFTEHQRTHSAAFPEMLEPTNGDHERRSSVMDGPGPDEEDTPVWHNTPEIRHSASQSEPFPTAIPPPESEHNTPFPAVDESPMSEPLPTARRQPAPSSIDTMEAIQFPELVPPRLEVMTSRADNSAITSELDRLLGDFLDALSATGEALSRTRIGSDTGNDHNATSE
ncbi:hypothetical protein FE257_005310 [Aspergillus nanangensis]|uniref:non-specific serine/threonine protein kinase n=1 Tax=Aspergillus nanangensis TaxID=2582783 RepID=A0AAD4GMT9_ASPNN|nr:hypothetical protein FE257_005310 [Aspergillus nanangensis]